MVNPRISVIIGIYNCAPTLVEALDSLYNQTFKDFKIILCDDGSSDDTYNVAKDYVSRHDNIILIRNECNMGLNYTLNHCLKYADTEYVARMDGDDISMPTRFEKEINFLFLTHSRLFHNQILHLHQNISLACSLWKIQDGHQES